jgi:hypothetical protein
MPDKTPEGVRPGLENEERNGGSHRSTTVTHQVTEPHGHSQMGFSCTGPEESANRKGLLQLAVNILELDNER